MSSSTSRHSIPVLRFSSIYSTLSNLPYFFYLRHSNSKILSILKALTRENTLQFCEINFLFAQNLVCASGQHLAFSENIINVSNIFGLSSKSTYTMGSKCIAEWPENLKAWFFHIFLVFAYCNTSSTLKS